MFKDAAQEFMGLHEFPAPTKGISLHTCRKGTAFGQKLQRKMEHAFLYPLHFSLNVYCIQDNKNYLCYIVSYLENGWTVFDHTLHSRLLPMDPE